MFVDHFSHEIYGKVIDMFGRLKFQPPQKQVLNQNLCCRKTKQDRVIDATFGCYRLKILDGISMEFMECLNEDAKKKNTFSVHWG